MRNWPAAVLLEEITQTKMPTAGIFCVKEVDKDVHMRSIISYDVGMCRMRSFADNTLALWQYISSHGL